MKVELLAPGGSYESAIAALNAGADAVYTGGEMFGARAGADNLTTEQLIEVIHYAHIHGKKLYLTVNTLLKDQEIEERLYDYLKPLYEAGLDAVIVQDFGVIVFIKEHFPLLHIHASTQMTILGKETVIALEKYGVQRIVTPRELSLEEISDIRNNTNLEIESFVHGALCYCYSGQCFMSSYIGGRSGNRGRCAQPCRMEYDIIQNGQVLNNKDEKYILSPKDICAIKLLPQIIESGVYSLKIEGRMKKLEYIAGVVSIYRKYLDMYLDNQNNFKVADHDIQNLLDLFNRNGFSESYYRQHNGRNMMSLKKVDFRKENKIFVDYLKEQYKGRKLKRSLNVYVNCMKDMPLEIYTYLDGKMVSVKGDVPQHAKNLPLDISGLKKQICKMGNTDFVINQIHINLDDDLFIPIGEINALRRTFIKQVTELTLQKYKRELLNGTNIKSLNQRNDHKREENSINVKSEIASVGIEINCLIWKKEQLLPVLVSSFVNTIYLECSQFQPEEIEKYISEAHRNGKKLYIAMPYILRKQDKDYFTRNYLDQVKKADGILIRNIEEYYCLKNFNVELNFIFDYNVYATNKMAKSYFHSLKVRTTASAELNYHELKRFDCSESELIVYGYMPVMISAGCGLKTLNRCNHSCLEYEIRDRINNRFWVKCVCDYCYNLMLNCNPLSLFKYYDEIKDLKPKSIRLIFTKEDERQVREILKNAEDTFLKEKKIKDHENSTRGHFKRGVL